MFKAPQNKSFFQKLGLAAKIVIGLELAGCAVSYLIWNKMNHEQDFRYEIYKISPNILNSYYTVGETLGGQSTRKSDYAAWGVKE